MVSKRDKLIEESINKQLEQHKGKAPIIREYLSYIVLAQSEGDYEGKCSRIRRGETRGFFRIKVDWK